MALIELKFLYSVIPMEIGVRKKCDELKDINLTTVEALERETKRS